MKAMSMYVDSLFEWAIQNPAISVPALIAAAPVLLGALASATATLGAAFVKAFTDILVALLNRSNGKSDSQPPEPKSPSR